MYPEMSWEHFAPILLILYLDYFLVGDINIPILENKTVSLHQKQMKNVLNLLLPKLWCLVFINFSISYILHGTEPVPSRSHEADIYNTLKTGIFKNPEEHKLKHEYQQNNDYRSLASSLLKRYRLKSIWIFSKKLLTSSFMLSCDEVSKRCGCLIFQQNDFKGFSKPILILFWYWNHAIAWFISKFNSLHY